MQSLKEFLILPESTENSSPSWFGFPITIKKDSGISRVMLIKHLDSYNIGTRLLFAGNLTRQPYFQDKKYRIVGNLKNSDIIMNHTFWIGLYPGLSSIQLDFVVEKLEELFGIGW
jgi:CDP-6-deoxy-D-xylo-4-hexulose-3-dehydrase